MTAPTALIDNPSPGGGNIPSPDRPVGARTLTRARGRALTHPPGRPRRSSEISLAREIWEARVTGHRRAIDRRDHDGRIAPLAGSGRAERIQAAVRSRYAGAQSGRDRLAAAHDYARSAAAAAERAGVDNADLLVAEAARALMAAGDALCAALAKQGRR